MMSSCGVFNWQSSQVVLQAKKMSVGGPWNLKRIEEKIQEKIHERVGGKGVFEVRATTFSGGSERPWKCCQFPACSL